MSDKAKEFLATWWKVAVIAVTLLLFVVRAWAEVIEVRKTPEQIKALQVQDVATTRMITDLARSQERSLVRNERRLDQFGFVLCDVLDRPAVDCTIGGIPGN